MFTTSQREVAGKNGPDAYSRIFKDETRLAVILHSDGYGRSG